MTVVLNRSNNYLSWYISHLILTDVDVNKQKRWKIVAMRRNNKKKKQLICYNNHDL